MRPVLQVNRRTVRAAANAVCGFILSSSVVVALLLPAPSVAAASSASDLEQPCVVVPSPCPLGQADEQTPSFSGTIAVPETHEGTIESLAPAVRPWRSAGQSGRNTYLRLHRLLL